MRISQYVYDYILFAGNIMCHVLSVVDVIISHFFLFICSVLYSAAKATSSLDLKPCQCFICYVFNKAMIHKKKKKGKKENV